MNDHGCVQEKFSFAGDWAPMCPSPWKPVVDTWADTPILPVDPRYRTVFHVDEPGAHVSFPMEACCRHLGRHAHSTSGPQVQNSTPCR